MKKLLTLSTLVLSFNAFAELITVTCDEFSTTIEGTSKVVNYTSDKNNTLTDIDSVDGLTSVTIWHDGTATASIDTEHTIAALSGKNCKVFGEEVSK